MTVTWNDGDRCAEFLIEELDICLFGAADVMIDCWFRCWGTNSQNIEVQLGEKRRFPLRKDDPSQNLIRELAVAELLRNPQYADRLADAGDMIDAAEQAWYPRDVGYGHQQHELI